MQKGHGIDYSGDILDDSFFNRLAYIQFDGVLLCNVMEHVTNIDGITQRIGKIIKPGGFLLFTGPFEYPVHYDPIDNGFRPEIKEVTDLFNNFNVIKAKIVNDYTYSHYLLRNKKNLFLTLIRVFTPFYKFNKWRNVVLPKLKWWNKQYKITCVLMQKGNIK
ncbi:MAG: class I SAM-dependent methyltransferase [Melioribacteraceae bacterium]|nr:class I SAM-dependent methyltransferase [Melioribacteraceae bacterium]